MPGSGEEFADLLARARRNDPGAQAELVCRYEAKVRLVARVLLGPALRPYLDSLDLVQSVHRSLLLGLRESKFAVSSAEQLVALATTMVRRKVARQWRHMRRQRRLESGAAEPADAPTLLTSLCGREPDPACAAQSSDAIRSLWNALDAAERRLVELRLHGYSTDEVAADLGLNAVVLRVRMTPPAPAPTIRRPLRRLAIIDGPPPSGGRKPGVTSSFS